MKSPVAVFLLVVASGLPCWSRERDGEINFLVLGDWGGKPESPYTTDTEREVADQMGTTAAEVGSLFTMALGDNFYDLGVKDASDPRFQNTFENVFTAKALQSRWYVVCGNHDHYGNASAEVAYTKMSQRWYMPEFYYTEVFSIPGTGANLQLVMIDTVLLAGLTHPVLRELPPSGPASLSRAEDQWQWIQETLASSTADWIIVAGHYPVWSIAEHGPTSILVEKLRPMLEKYNVSSYLCGHDHNLQHIRESSSPVDYFVVGAGHLTDPSTAHEKDIPPDSLKFHYGVFDISESHGGFATVGITNKIMTTTFYDAKGNKLYSANTAQTRSIM
ncbi:Tartrate-resistant acid phosphatase type 5 [Geodia barretti]|uniref:Tartrate-resistant acid phosphatase type 5 n=1 Tax=Geodia barretti TaxID=519541 RepID=A0AA35WVW0_GEOBA|nr:Tartrate-resistant acid phosphatase type 5 [Geodia barretti]